MNSAGTKAARSTAGRTRLAVAPLICVLSIGAYAVIDAALFGVNTAQRVAYALVWGSVVMACLVEMPRARVSRSGWRWIAVWLFVAAVGTLPTAWQTHVYPAYAAGDLASILLPLVLFLAGSAVPSLFGIRAVAVLTGALTLGLVVAPLVGKEGARFEAPATFLLAMAAWLVIAARTRTQRVLGVGLGIVTLAANYASGQRTSVIIWLVLAIAVISSLLGVKRVLLAAIVAVIVLLSPAREALLPGLQTSIQSTRFGTVIAGDKDESLFARFNEAVDVVRTLRREGGPINWLVGFGHGATYQPALSFLARNVTDDGRVHNIHIGPLMILFRYGLLGVAIATALAVAVVRSVVRLRSSLHESSAPLQALFALAVFGFLIEGLMFNVLVDPVFSYAIAGFLLHSRALAARASYLQRNAVAIRAA
jgi:hypothetical protein